MTKPPVKKVISLLRDDIINIIPNRYLNVTQVEQAGINKIPKEISPDVFSKICGYKNSIPEPIVESDIYKYKEPVIPKTEVILENITLPEEIRRKNIREELDAISFKCIKFINDLLCEENFKKARISILPSDMVKTSIKCLEMTGLGKPAFEVNNNTTVVNTIDLNSIKSALYDMRQPIKNNFSLDGI